MGIPNIVALNTVVSPYVDKDKVGFIPPGWLGFILDLVDSTRVLEVAWVKNIVGRSVLVTRITFARTISHIPSILTTNHIDRVTLPDQFVSKSISKTILIR